MQASRVINHVPVPAIRSFGTASGVNDAAETIVWCALGPANRAATGQPARPWRRRSGAEIPAKCELDDRRSVIDHIDGLARRLEGGPRRQGGRVHADGVSAQVGHQYFSYSEIVSSSASHITDAHLNSA